MAVMPGAMLSPSPIMVNCSASGRTLASNVSLPDMSQASNSAAPVTWGGIGEGGCAALGDAADMVAMHVGDHHAVDLIWLVARGAQRAGDAAGVEAGVKEDELRPGIDHRGGEEELRLVGGDIGGRGGGGEILLAGVEAEDGLRIGHGCGCLLAAP